MGDVYAIIIFCETQQQMWLLVSKWLVTPVLNNVEVLVSRRNDEEMQTQKHVDKISRKLKYLFSEHLRNITQDDIFIAKYFNSLYQFQLELLCN